MKINECAFETSVYRKTTHTGVFLNFLSVCPIQWKRGLITCLINRAKCISSSVSLFNAEVSRLRDMFVNNCYPIRFFDNTVNRLLNPRRHSTQSSEDDTAAPSYSILRVPYHGKDSVKFAKKMISIVAEKFNVDLRVVYTTFKVKNYFRLKSATPFPLLSNVVYKYNCVANPQISYIGYTKRHMTTRVMEHTQSPHCKKSHVFAHINNCDKCKQCKPGVHDFHVLRKCVDETECRIAEALSIKRFRPAINKQLHDQGLSHILRIWR